MNEFEGGTALLDAPESETFDFQVTDVTRSRTLRARNVQRSLPAGAVARSLAAHLKMPDNVPWTLRSDKSSAYLDEKRPIGEQIEPNSQVTLSPVTHLGAPG
jgi:hypothetical protein